MTKQGFLISDADMYDMKISTFGAFSIFSKTGQPIAQHGKIPKKPIELIKIVIAMSGKEVSAEAVMDKLWPDLDGDYAYKTLLTNIRRARKILGHPDSIIFQAGYISINRDIIWVDCFAFKDELDKILIVDNGKNPAKIVASGQAIIDLYKGHFLEHDQYTWVVPMREHMKAYFCLLGEYLGKYYEENDRYFGEVLKYYNFLINIDDSIEVFYQRLMEYYIKMGRTGDAMRTYKRCEAVLQAKFFIKPSNHTTQLYEGILHQ